MNLNLRDRKEYELEWKMPMQSKAVLTFQNDLDTSISVSLKGVTESGFQRRELVQLGGTYVGSGQSEDGEIVGDWDAIQVTVAPMELPSSGTVEVFEKQQ